MTRYVPYQQDAVGTALGYAAAGWPVFPCVPNGKAPATPHGFKDATVDHHQIDHWWCAHPDYNVAVRTGAPGPDVLDVDVRISHCGTVNTGYHTLDILQDAGLIDGWTAMVRTRSGGLHIYYPGTIQRCRALPACLIDFKAHGGYVLAPPRRRCQPTPASRR